MEALGVARWIALNLEDGEDRRWDRLDDDEQR